MSKKLELIWIKGEGRNEPRVRVELPVDTQREDSPAVFYEATLEVCSNPRCDCSNILFQWVSEAPAGVPLSSPEGFYFNLVDNLIQANLGNESLRLAEIIRDELTGADRVQLYNWFLSAKLQMIETTPPGEMDYSNLPNAFDGVMIGFADVFHFGMPLRFTLNDEIWVVDDQYCVQSHCQCTETALAFWKLADLKGPMRNRRVKWPALQYNYESEKIERLSSGPTGYPSPKNLMAAFKQSQPELKLRLALHHSILQTLYLHQERDELKAVLKSLPLPSSKIGRNEPCPCGSGRKYKQCCLNKTESNS